MFDKLDSIEKRFKELDSLLVQPEVISNPQKYKETSRLHAELSPIVEKYSTYKKVLGSIEESKKILAEAKEDEELQQLVEEELGELEETKANLIDELKLLLIPKDPNDKKNVIIEIRAGTGGEEASLFAQQIFRMYSRYAENHGWKVEVTGLHPTGVGGLKEVTAIIEGEAAYSRLKYESGVHRVQRVPVTEASGRIHTSAVTVAVLPEAEDVDIKLDEKQLRIDRFCSSGPGGQSVNTTYSAVRITHLPTGMVVTCQDERSQHKNKARALRVIRSRLYDLALQKQRETIAKERRNQVGTGDRSEKIRTYNFPQARVSDHRIGLTLHRLEEILNGGLDPLIEALITHFQTEKLKKEVEA
ncbi:peptide chain release factor 1 [bacterium (candidate division B38) B3_B38]|nr:MAG: peptide chain release factor 1 [bacterium (candidate division B38) B3_B38]